jgi:hypothetical protein
MVVVEEVLTIAQIIMLKELLPLVEEGEERTQHHLDVLVVLVS